MSRPCHNLLYQHLVRLGFSLASEGFWSQPHSLVVRANTHAFAKTPGSSGPPNHPPIDFTMFLRMFRTRCSSEYEVGQLFRTGGSNDPTTHPPHYVSANV